MNYLGTLIFSNDDYTYELLEEINRKDRSDRDFWKKDNSVSEEDAINSDKCEDANWYHGG